MTSYALDHPAVRDYLVRLDAATAHLPPDERTEIAEGIRSHLVAALGPGHTEADIRTTLDALGTPEEIVGQPPSPTPRPAPVQPAPAPAGQRGWLEITAVVFLLVGAVIIPLIGWFVGVVLLWTSKAWSTGQKVLGTVVVPGGLAVAPLLAFLVPVGAFAQTCTATIASDGTSVQACSGGLPGWLSLAIALFSVAGPIVVAVYLLRAAGRPRT